MTHDLDDAVMDDTHARRRAALEERLEARRRTGRRRLLLGITLALVVGAGLAILLPDLVQDLAPRARQPAAPEDVRTPPRHATGSAREGRLLARGDFVRTQEGLTWTDGADRTYLVRQVGTDRSVLLETAAGPLRVPTATHDRHRKGPPADLPAIIAAAREAGLELSQTELLDDGFRPLHVRHADFLVVAAGAMRLDPTAAVRGVRERASAKAALRDAIGSYLTALSSAPVDASTRQALAQIVGAVGQDEGRYFSSLAPHVTRRLIRHGWLRQIGADPEATRALEDTVASAVTPRTNHRFAGPGGSLTRMHDIFGNKQEILATAEGVWFDCPQPKPQWLGPAPKRRVTVQLPAHADPFADTVTPVAARLEPYEGRWKDGGVLTLDVDAWRRAMRRRFGNKAEQPDNLFPPHALLTNGLGDAQLLVTQHGVVRPARDASLEERTRFFDACARALPDAAHMDLIGEILYTYAWDTAQYDRPLLIGTEQFNGEIHQTAEQTLQTCCGGIYRGDCDDLACFYHALTRHQGRNAHVLSLPHHLANAYAEQREDGTWAVHVLHTGPPMELTGATLAEAIERTYKAFESQESVDLGALAFSLRFGGDPVRQRYMLPYEIFRDARYAGDLIEVQAAYRFHTYANGIETMRRILAARPAASTADHREIAHLLSWAERDAEATPAFEQALAVAREPATRVDAALDLLGNLVARGQAERVRALADRLATKEIPAFERAVGQRLAEPWIRMANTLLGEKAFHADALALLAGTGVDRATGAFLAIEELAQRKGFDPRWLHYNGFPRHTHIVSAFIGSALGVLGETREAMDEASLEHRRVLDRVVHRWLTRIAFRTRHQNTPALGLYESVASYYEGRIGRANLERLVARATLPTPMDLARAGMPPAFGPAPDPFHLRMIRMCEGYHRARWWRGLVAEDDAFDALATRQAIHDQLAAIDSAERAGMGHFRHAAGTLLGRIALAVLAADPEALRPLLAHAAAGRDFGLEDMVVRLLGAAARRHAPERWLPLATAWAETMGRMPDFLNLAWSAMRHEQPAHAVAMGRLTVARFPDRADFAKELAQLEHVAKTKTAPQATEKAKEKDKAEK